MLRLYCGIKWSQTNNDPNTPTIRGDYGFVPCGARKRLINSRRFNRYMETLLCDRYSFPSLQQSVGMLKDVNSVMVMIHVPKSNEKHFVFQGLNFCNCKLQFFFIVLGFLVTNLMQTHSHIPVTQGLYRNLWSGSEINGLQAIDCWSHRLGRFGQ